MKPESRVPAWPFVVGRAKRTGYRVVAAPDFMEECPQTVNALSTATRTVEVPEGSAAVRELIGLTAVGPLCVVYRSVIARDSDYAAEYAEELIDDLGRGIRIAEGLVVRRAAASLHEVGITVADFEHAHGELVPIFHRFWEEGDAFERRATRAFPLRSPEPGSGSVPGSGPDEHSRLLTLVTSGPWQAPQPESPQSEAVSVSDDDDEPESQTSLSARSGLLGERGSVSRVWGEVTSKRFMSALLYAAVVSALIVVSVYLVRGHSAAPTAETSASQGSQPLATLDEFCAALTRGELGTAYGAMSPGFRQSTPRQAFDAEILSGGTHALSSCTPTISSTDGGTVDARISTVPEAGRGAGELRQWTVTIVQEAGGEWEIASLMPIVNSAGGMGGH